MGPLQDHTTQVRFYLPSDFRCDKLTTDDSWMAENFSF